MRITAVTASMLLVFLSLPSINDAASAQTVIKTVTKRVVTQRPRNREVEDIDGPIPLSKFPGMGNIDDWKASVPEYREGMNKMRMHRWDEAIAHFKAAVELYQYQPAAWLNIGRCIEKRDGAITDAEAAYRHCLKLDAQNLRCWKCLGNVLFIQKKNDEARQSLANAMNLNPTPRQRRELGKMIQMVDSSERNANTKQMNAAD